MRLIAVSGSSLVMTSPVLSKMGDIEYIVYVTRDITRQNKAEAILKHVQKMEVIGTLAGGNAHGFNNILSVLFGKPVKLKLLSKHLRQLL